MTLLYPLVQKALESQLTQADFAELERVGAISLSAQLRKRLNGIAHSWTGARQTPRPKQFGTRLKLIKESLVKAHAALDLNRAGAAMWEHHLFNWAGNAKVEAAGNFFEDADELLARMQRMIGLVESLKQRLPPDPGRIRPYDDERFFIALAAVFTEAGGTSVAYKSEPAEEGWADKPFRRFVQNFYKLLPVKSKRRRTGVDKAMLGAAKLHRSR